MAKTSTGDVVVEPSYLPRANIPLKCGAAYLHARDWRAGGKITVNEASLASFTTTQDVGWVRTLISVPADCADAAHVLVRLLPGSEIPPDVSFGIGYADDKGVFAIAQRHKVGRSIVPSEHPISFPLPGSFIHQLSKKAPGPGALYAFLEFRGKCKINLGSVETISGRLDQHGIPLRLSSLPAYRDLSELNDRLPAVTRQNLTEWMLREVTAAIRLECFETGRGILDQISDADGLSPDLLKTYLKVSSEILIAEGRVTELRQTLTNHLEITSADDELWANYSACFPATEDAFHEFGRLPSGKLNRFYLSRLLPSNHLPLAKLLSASKPITDDWLLIASMLRKSMPTSYLNYWNKYLKSQNLATIASVDLTAENILSSIRFTKTRDIEHGPLVSIIMSAHNSARTIDYAVKSILQQTYRNIELLVCDDGSSDAITEALDQYRSDRRLRLFRSKANQGTYNIRNYLFEKAKGKYLTFQDSDDFAHPQRIERQLASILAANTPVVVGRWIRMRPNGEVVFFRDQRCVRMSVVSIFAETEFFKREGYRRVACAADTEFLENVRVHWGQNSVFQMAETVILGLWSEQSLTRQPGMEASEDGYRSAARRAYAEVATRQRILGRAIVCDDDVEAVLRANGIARNPTGVVEIGDRLQKKPSRPLTQREKARIRLPASNRRRSA